MKTTLLLAAAALAVVAGRYWLKQYTYGPDLGPAFRALHREMF